MTTINKICKQCNVNFEASLKEHKRGFALFCGKECFNKHPKEIKLKLNNATCAQCNIEFYKKPSSFIQSKSGFYFCSRNCKDGAQKIGGIPEIQPSHYGNGKSTYRDIAFSLLPKQCNRCGYNKYLDILHVHHKDRNRENPDINNLEILCPTCHNEEHFLAKDGAWG